MPFLPNKKPWHFFGFILSPVMLQNFSRTARFLDMPSQESLSRTRISVNAIDVMFAPHDVNPTPFWPYSHSSPVISDHQFLTHDKSSTFFWMSKLGRRTRKATCVTSVLWSYASSASGAVYTFLCDIILVIVVSLALPALRGVRHL